MEAKEMKTFWTLANFFIANSSILISLYSIQIAPLDSLKSLMPFSTSKSTTLPFALLLWKLLQFCWFCCLFRVVEFLFIWDNPWALSRVSLSTLSIINLNRFSKFSSIFTWFSINYRRDLSMKGLTVHRLRVAMGNSFSSFWIASERRSIALQLIKHKNPHKTRRAAQPGQIGASSTCFFLFRHRRRSFFTFNKNVNA